MGFYNIYKPFVSWFATIVALLSKRIVKKGLLQFELNMTGQKDDENLKRKLVY